MSKVFDIFSYFAKRHKYFLPLAIFCCIMFCAGAVWAATGASATDECETPGLFSSYNKETYLCYCKSSVIDKKYAEAGCWSCTIVETLMISLSDIASKLFGTVVDISKTILVLGAAIWIALYFLKALGSFATQDPAKIIDGLLTFCFKVALVYAVIDSGLGFIIQYIVSPLLSIGYDVGTTFANATGISGWGASSGGGVAVSIGGESLGAMDSLVQGVKGMSEKIHEASSVMMKIADMLLCNARFGEAAYQHLLIDIKLIAFDIFISGCVLYVLGFFIAVVASFYMFDVAFNLSICIVLLPLALALWPFGWTRDKLGKVVESIAYYTGIFIFLPLGILIGAELVKTIIGNAFGADIQTIFDEDKSDIIRDKLGVFSLTFLKVLVSYLVAMRLIPLMASEFCGHFFGEALVGSPLSERISQAVSALNKRTVGKAMKYGKDVVKHQTGKRIQAAGEKIGGLKIGKFNVGAFPGRVLERYGRQVGRTRK